jgi:hypothetical protein
LGQSVELLIQLLIDEFAEGSFFDQLHVHKYKWRLLGITNVEGIVVIVVVDCFTSVVHHIRNYRVNASW